MKTPARLAVVLAAAAGGATAIASPALAGPTHGSGAVFVATDATDGNAVIAYDRGLHERGTYSTGRRVSMR